MNALRHHIRRHRRWAAAFILVALFIEILVPAGYMPDMTNGIFGLRLCAGQNTPVTMMAVSGASDSAMHGDHHKNQPANDDHAKMEMPCVFSSLAGSALGPVDPVLLAIAIAFIFCAALRAEQRIIVWRGMYLRPPSQGPPATT